MRTDLCQYNHRIIRTGVMLRINLTNFQVKFFSNDSSSMMSAVGFVAVDELMKVAVGGCWPQIEQIMQAADGPIVSLLVSDLSLFSQRTNRTGHKTCEARLSCLAVSKFFQICLVNHSYNVIFLTVALGFSVFLSHHDLPLRRLTSPHSTVLLELRLWSYLLANSSQRLVPHGTRCD